jgi:hypothetical protein
MGTHMFVLALFVQLPKVKLSSVGTDSVNDAVEQSNWGILLIPLA